MNWFLSQVKTPAYSSPLVHDWVVLNFAFKIEFFCNVAQKLFWVELIRLRFPRAAD